MAKHYWKNKSAVVCGATSGLGRSVACELALAGVANLALLARGREKLENLQRTLTNDFPKTRILIEQVDLCQATELSTSVDSLMKKMESVDLAVQAVGRSDRGTIQELEIDCLRELMDANLVSSLNALQLFAPAMQKPGGRIVLIGSLASLFAPRYLGGYALAKHALAGLAQQARLEFAADGLHVLLACPGPIARADAGERYRSSSNEARLPAEALKPGGGAKVRGLDAKRLAQDILNAAAKNKRVIIRPRSARLLYIAAAVSSKLGDHLLKKMSS